MNEGCFVVIGAGAIGVRHHRNIKNLGRQVKLLSFRDDGYVRLKNILLQREYVLGVVVATATQVRLEILKLCADYGVPTYCEKPLCYSRHQLQKIKRLNNEFRNICFVGFMTRFHPVVSFVRHRLENQLIYDIDLRIGLDVNRWRENWSFEQSYAARENGGGVLLDLCHEIDIACMLIGSQLDIKSVTSLGFEPFKNVDFLSSISLCHKIKSCSVSIKMDYLNPVSVRRGSILTENEFISYDMIEGVVKIASDKGIEKFQFPYERDQLFIEAISEFVLFCEEYSENGGRSAKDIHLMILPTIENGYAVDHLICECYRLRDFKYVR